MPALGPARAAAAACVAAVLLAAAPTLLAERPLKGRAREKSAIHAYALQADSLLEVAQHSGRVPGDWCSGCSSDAPNVNTFEDKCRAPGQTCSRECCLSQDGLAAALEAQASQALKTALEGGELGTKRELEKALAKVRTLGASAPEDIRKAMEKLGEDFGKKHHEALRNLHAALEGVQWADIRERVKQARAVGVPEGDADMKKAHRVLAKVSRDFPIASQQYSRDYRLIGKDRASRERFEQASKDFLNGNVGPMTDSMTNHLDAAVLPAMNVVSKKLFELENASVKFDKDTQESVNQAGRDARTSLLAQEAFNQAHRRVFEEAKESVDDGMKSLAETALVKEDSHANNWAEARLDALQVLQVLESWPLDKTTEFVSQWVAKSGKAFQDAFSKVLAEQEQPQAFVKAVSGPVALAILIRHFLDGTVANFGDKVPGFHISENEEQNLKKRFLKAVQTAKAEVRSADLQQIKAMIEKVQSLNVDRTDEDAAPEQQDLQVLLETLQAKKKVIEDLKAASKGTEASKIIEMLIVVVLGQEFGDKYKDDQHVMGALAKALENIEPERLADKAKDNGLKLLVNEVDKLDSSVLEVQISLSGLKARALVLELQAAGTVLEARAALNTYDVKALGKLKEEDRQKVEEALKPCLDHAKKELKEDTAIIENVASLIQKVEQLGPLNDELKRKLDELKTDVIALKKRLTGEAIKALNVADEKTTASDILRQRA